MVVVRGVHNFENLIERKDLQIFSITQNTNLPEITFPSRKKNRNNTIIC